MARDPEKAKARARRYRERRKVEKYGPNATGIDMRGRHGKHAAGAANGRYSHRRLVTSHGYVLVRVERSHPLAFGPPGLRGAYAYEHAVVAMAMLGRELRVDEVVHHRNGDRADNRPGNLEVTTRSAHAREHGDFPGARDEAGRFKAGAPRHGDPAEWPEDLRVRQWPEPVRA